MAATVLLLLPGLPVDRTGGTGTVPRRVGTIAVIRDNLPVLRTLGLGILLVGALRAARQTVIPLWGAHLDLDPVGSGAGPLLIAAVLTVGPLSAAVLTMAGVGAVAVTVLHRFTPRPVTTSHDR